MEYWNYITKLFENPLVKSAVGILLMLVHAQPAVIIALIILITIDFITGIWKSIRKGEKVQSKLMRRTVVKVVDYFLFIISCLVLGNAFNLLWIIDWSLAFVAITELKSIAENLYGVNFRKQISEIIEKGSDKNNL